jgi:protocatechuate 3,4-dioxygenase beta subunit
MKKAYLLILFNAISLASFAQKSPDPCEDCDLLFQGMPDRITYSTHLAGPGESGVPIYITGTIYLPDGKTPATDIILYVYQTDHSGKYTPGPNQIHGKRHGHLRGWVRTNEQGRYEIHTILPGSYPNSNIPKHIHPIIYEPKRNLYYWIDDYLFDNDPFLTQEERRKQSTRGGGGILALTKGQKEEWVGRRDIILGQNIPNYQKR